MAAKQKILFHLFMATVAIALLETTVAYEHHPNHDGPPSDHYHIHAADNDSDADGERKFRWPGSVGITINREGKVDGPASELTELNRPPNTNAAGNNFEGSERKIHWPSSATITIHRSAQQIGPNGLNVSSNDTDGERKFHWPSSISVTVNRAGQLGPNDPINPHSALENDTDNERKFHWPSYISPSISRGGEGPNGPNNSHSAPENDTDGERKFHWPSSMSLTIGRAAQYQGGDIPQLPESPKLEQLLLGLQLVSCNHTTQAGRSCADCSHSLLCFPNNVGIQRDCGSEYCDEGRCSPQPSAACNTTSNV